MRVFVVGPGRTGTTTLAAAFGHATNVTAAHESRAGRFGADRWRYPDEHNEVDNRLSWLLGPLIQHYPDARFIQSVRDPTATAASHQARLSDLRELPQRVQRRLTPHPSMLDAFGHHITQRSRQYEPDEANALALAYVETVNANIELAIGDRVIGRIDIDDPHVEFVRVWGILGLVGDLPAALAEFQIRRN
ncbi:MAG: hypothetical protein QG597_3848 [Actinomycetota bacterium]|nr:hypothetical protein [Actinomycetota bacterium]